eukprot:g47918.t1
MRCTSAMHRNLYLSSIAALSSSSSATRCANLVLRVLAGFLHLRPSVGGSTLVRVSTSTIPCHATCLSTKAVD